MNTDKLIESLKQNISLSTETPYVIAIDGMCASGKTTLGQLLQEHFPESNLFHMDDFFLQPHQRTEERLAEIGGNVDYERFLSEVLQHINDQHGLTYQKFDCKTQTFGSTLHIPWKPIVIIEGAYSQHPYFGDIYSTRIFCEISRDKQIERIQKRNGTQKLERFLNEWIPKELAYFEKLLKK